MTEERVHRRLAAIFAADMVGYSRLMEADEEGVIARQRRHRQELIDPKIAEYDGRIVKLMGDGMLVEFASVVDAVRCAAEVQQAMVAREADLPEDKRIRYRVGVNLGDIVIDGDDILGDGVNVAARLEGLAKPGGICISDMVHQSVAGKIDLDFEDLGEQQVKNIKRPVRAYGFQFDEMQPATVSAGETRAPSPAYSDKLSIAVLPLDNMSGDAEQDYFADGIAEDIITELSRFRELLVIARNSAFTYKGKAVNIQEVGRELGVRYVVEGSVRKVGNRVRITAQLIDAADGSHLWADKFDRDLDDIFAVQDEITRIIVATLPGRLEAANIERAKRAPTTNMTAHDYLQRGKHHHRQGTKEDNDKAIECLQKAVEIDPSYAQAWAELACTCGQAYVRQFRDRDEITPMLVEAIERAHKLDDNESECHRLLCELNLIQKNFETARYHHERALALNPNDPRIVSQRGDLLTWQGKGEEGLEWLEKTNRLDPYHPDGRAYSTGRALFTARRYADAMAAFKRIHAPQAPQHAFMAACAAHMGDVAAAEAHAKRVVELMPAFAIGTFLETLPYVNEADIAHYREGLRTAGLPA
jgi:adenylate cyclase